jgi:hypothetical protein
MGTNRVRIALSSINVIAISYLLVREGESIILIERGYLRNYITRLRVGYRAPMVPCTLIIGVVNRLRNRVTPKLVPKRRGRHYISDR